MINLFVCTANPSPIGFCDPKFDADANDSRQTFDNNQRIADFKDAQKIIYASVPTVYYERTYTWVFTAPTIQGVALYQNAIPFFDRLWIKTH
jgi:ABC-type transport system substrate-binding protein